ncbi:MAG: hypothetical protein QOD72_2196 [Acidimicrobiaceae bacterium]|jgi:uncharacterized cupin superfamily protein|nr:hypothetical protein [Acidimicrobiaceae bacterium]
MKVSRLYSGDDGQSHWDEIELEMQTDAFSTEMAATFIQIRDTPGDDRSDWHPVPRRQFVVILSGEAEYEVGDGSTRRFGPGGIFLAEDLVGQGHRRRNGSGPRTVMIVPLAD